MVFPIRSMRAHGPVEELLAFKGLPQCNLCSAARAWINPEQHSVVATMAGFQNRSEMNPGFGQLRLTEYFVMVYCIIRLIGGINLELAPHLQASCPSAQ